MSDPSWDPATWNIHDAATAETLNPGNIRTWPDDLSPFRDNGGKIVTFHGGQDNQITIFNSERFYNRLSRGMQASSSDLDEFYRFFRVPGMYHCGSGPGAWVLGQGGSSSAAGIPFSSVNNVLAALVSWVENGTAPDTITGTKFLNDTVSLGVAYQRQHCRQVRPRSTEGSMGANIL